MAVADRARRRAGRLKSALAPADARKVRSSTEQLALVRGWDDTRATLRRWRHRDVVQEHGIRLRCVLSGRDEGNLEYVLRCAADLGVRDRVIYVGSVEVDDMPPLYRNATALVFPSAVGPDNLPPLEAMSLGCPVITADVPGTREQCGDAALFFPPMDERQLADRIADVVRTDGLRDQLIQAGFRRAASWTADDYIGAVLVILDEFARVARNWEHSNVKLT